jgi:hypothetical protein
MHLDILQPTNKIRGIRKKKLLKRKENVIDSKCYLFSHYKDRRISRHFFI